MYHSPAHSPPSSRCAIILFCVSGATTQRSRCNMVFPMFVALAICEFPMCIYEHHFARCLWGGVLVVFHCVQFRALHFGLEFLASAQSAKPFCKGEIARHLMSHCGLFHTKTVLSFGWTEKNSMGGVTHILPRPSNTTLLCLEEPVRGSHPLSWTIAVSD